MRNFDENVNSFTIPKKVVELYDNCFNSVESFNMWAIGQEGGQFPEADAPTEWTKPYDSPEEGKIFGTFDNPEIGQFQYFHILEIDKGSQDYHLQLGNPYKYRTWNKMFYRCYSWRKQLHHYFDGYTVKTTKIGETIPSDYVLIPSDVDAMIDGYEN